MDADLFFLLEIEGSFWFFPSWMSMYEGIDYEAVHLPAGYQGNIVILPEFTMPPVPDAGPYYFYSVAFQPGTLSLETMISNLDIKEFFLGA